MGCYIHNISMYHACYKHVPVLLFLCGCFTELIISLALLLLATPLKFSVVAPIIQTVENLPLAAVNCGSLSDSCHWLAS